MAKKLFSNLGFATASLVLSFLSIGTSSAQAAILTYDINVLVNSCSGPNPLCPSRIGDIGSGTLSYDDTGLTNSGIEYVSPAKGNLTVDFTLRPGKADEITVTEKSQNGFSVYPNFPRLYLNNGSINYLLFNLSSGFSGFAFEYLAGKPDFYDSPDAYDYSPKYTFVSSTPTPVPEPNLTLALAAVLCTGIALKHQLKKQS